jgi:hypothetical protein
MYTTQRWMAAVACGTMVLLDACGGLCGDQQHAISIFSLGDSLTVTQSTVTRRVSVIGRVTPYDINPTSFDFAFNTLEGSAAGEGVTLTLSGQGAASNEQVTLVLALPVSLRRGDEYSLGATFSVDPGFVTDPRTWGAYDLKQSNQAEASFTISRYTFPPAEFTVDYRAVTSSGTVRVAARDNGSVELLLNLTFLDAAGKTTTVTGRARAVTESFSPPCN